MSASTVMGEEVADVSVAREDRKMSVVADPNAIQHLDALFEVVHVHRSPDRRSSSIVTQKANTALLDALFEVIHTESSATGGATTQKANAKSWKERELPPSFFNAGSNPGAGMNSPDKNNPSESQKTKKTPVPSSPQQKPHLHKVSTTPTLAVVSTSPVAYTVALPTSWQGPKPSDCLTYYIDKNLQCSVNLEPAVERRRRLARGRVQKYRSRKRWQKVPSSEDNGGIHVVKIESVY